MYLLVHLHICVVCTFVFVWIVCLVRFRSLFVSFIVPSSRLLLVFVCLVSVTICLFCLSCSCSLSLISCILIVRLSVPFSFYCDCFLRKCSVFVFLCYCLCYFVSAFWFVCYLLCFCPTSFLFTVILLFVCSHLYLFYPRFLYEISTSPLISELQTILFQTLSLNYVYFSSSLTHLPEQS